MGIRIWINWEIVSPFLKKISGVVHVTEASALALEPTTLFKCKVTKDQYSLGYKPIDENDGIPEQLFHLLKPTIDIMTRQYYDGVILNKESVIWVEDSLKCNNYNSWLKNQGYEIKENDKRYIEKIKS
jgi:hypothetical protein